MNKTTERIRKLMEHHAILDIVIGLIHSGLTYLIIDWIAYWTFIATHKYELQFHKIQKITRSVWNFKIENRNIH